MKSTITETPGTCHPGDGTVEGDRGTRAPLALPPGRRTLCCAALMLGVAISLTIAALIGRIVPAVLG